MTNNKATQPILRLPLSPTLVALEIAAAVGILAIALFLFQSWASLPPTIPVHFGLTGKPDAWGSKQILWILLALVVVLYLGLTVVNRFPHTFNYPYPITEQNALRQYQLALGLMGWMKADLIWLFAFIEWQMLQVGLGASQGLGVAFLPVIMLVIFGTVGFYFRQAYLAR